MKLEKYLCIYPDGRVQWVAIDRDDLLDDLYRIIGCRCVERVRTTLKDIVIIIDESGKLKDPPKLHNELASRLYAGWLYGDDIVGPAVVMGLRRVPPYWEEDWCQLSFDQLNKLSKVLGVKFDPLSDSGG